MIKQYNNIMCSWYSTSQKSHSVYTVETGNESFLDLNRMELGECVYGRGGR